MSDVREVSEYHEWYAGTLYGIAECIDNELHALIDASGIPKLALRILRAM